MGQLLPGVVVRRATANDIPFMLELARELYPGRGPPEKGVGWVEWALKNPERVVFVGPNSMGIGEISWNYGFERKARLGMLAARKARSSPLEAYQMLRMMVLWAKMQGAVGGFRLDADTGVDFGAFARRLGGKQVESPRYDIPIDGGPL